MVCTSLQNQKKLGWFSTLWTYGQKSLNKELMSGSDLTNQIVGLLLIFREGRVKFMEDIRTKLYQVQVPEEDRSFLRFF